MTISLDQLSTNPTLCLKSYRDAASFVSSRDSDLLRVPLEPRLSKPSSPPCGSPPRFYPGSTLRCRTRLADSSPERSPPSPSSTKSGSKVARSTSPGPASSSPGVTLRRRVCWAGDLVSSVKTRPRTLRKDIPLLFYSKADERRFRREAEHVLDDEWCEETEGATPPTPFNDREEEHKPLWSPQRERKEYSISKAVVVFGESTKTYGAGCALEAAFDCWNSNAAPVTFDDATFWNGVLTWS